WAACFKATTWEEVKMLASQNPILEDAVATMYEMSAEDAIREQCRAREDYYRTLNTLKAHIDNRDKLLEQHIQLLERRDQEIEQKEQLLGQKNLEIEKKEQLLEQKDLEIEQKRATAWAERSGDLASAAGSRTTEKAIGFRHSTIAALYRTERTCPLAGSYLTKVLDCTGKKFENLFYFD
ncbi:MAG: hypothetical protein K2K19_09495, partial [Acetatifactor sp.]|nr:hypothetical protein [Acetatifactor sp.]